MSYVIENDAPLILSRTNENASETCILGQNILGFLAGKYLLEEGKDAESEEFQDLFLNLFSE